MRLGSARVTGYKKPVTSGLAATQERFPEAGPWSVCRSYEDFESPECSTAARLSLTGVQLLDCALQLFKLLPRLAELAFCGEALVIGKVFRSFRDEGIEIRRRLRS